MKRYTKSKLVALILAASLILMTMNCGLILYPERKGTKSGEIDVRVLVMDCLWLIVGLAPGVVALVVDFATGCIYEPGGLVKAEPGEAMVFRLRGEAPADARMELSLAGPDGQERTSLFSRDFVRGETFEEVALTLPAELEPGTYRLDVTVNGQVSSWFNLEVSI